MKAKSCGDCRFSSFADGFEVGDCRCPIPKLPAMPDSVLVSDPERYKVWKTDGETCPAFEAIEDKKPCAHEWELAASGDRKVGGRRCQICRRFEAVDPKTGSWQLYRQTKNL